MNTVYRTKGIRKLIRVITFRGPVQRFVTAGSRACGKMMREARPRPQKPGPSDRAILACARFDLAREIISGFWDVQAA